MRRTARLLWYGYLAALLLLVLSLWMNQRSRVYTSAEKLHEQIAFADYSAKQIQAVLSEEQLRAKELEAKSKEEALQRKLAALDLLTEEADTQLAQIQLREGHDPALMIAHVAWAFCALACAALLWTGPLSRWILANRGRGFVSRFLQRRTLLRIGFKLSRDFRADERHEVLEQAGVVRAHIAMAVRILTQLYSRVPTREQSDVPMMRNLLLALEDVFAELGIREVDPYATKWCELADAERAFAREREQALRELQQRQSHLDGEVKHGVAAALEKLDVKAREAAVAAATAEKAATERRDEATRALAKLVEEQARVGRSVTAAAESQAEAERLRAAAAREHQAAEQQLKAVQRERLVLEKLLVQLEAWAEFLTERILAEMETQPMLKQRVAEWLRLVVPAGV